MIGAERPRRREIPFSPYDRVLTTVRAEHIDAYQHANYRGGHLALLEDGREAFLLRRGLSLEKLWEEHKLRSFIFKLDEITYGSQLKEGDLISIDTAVAFNSLKVIFDQTITHAKSGMIATKGRITTVLVDMLDRPVYAPENIKQALLSER